MFDKILVPLDGSEHSIRALEIAIQIAKKFCGKITLIHVYSVGAAPLFMPEPATLTPGIPVMAKEEYLKIMENAREAGLKILAKGKEKANAEGVEVETLLREGNVANEIVKTAEEGKFNLIVMGAKGISRIKEILIGSVSDGVVRKASCPVLITK